VSQKVWVNHIMRKILNTSLICQRGNLGKLITNMTGTATASLNYVLMDQPIGSF